MIVSIYFFWVIFNVFDSLLAPFPYPINISGRIASHYQRKLAMSNAFALLLVKTITLEFAFFDISFSKKLMQMLFNDYILGCFPALSLSI